MKLKRMLIYASVGYWRMRSRKREAFSEVTIKLITVCNELLERDKYLILPQHSFISAAGYNFNFRETCGIEELPAPMLKERLPLEMAMTMLEKETEEIDLTEFDILWSEEPFRVNWGESTEHVTPGAREALEAYLKSFELPGTWTCEWEGGSKFSIWLGKCMFLINSAKVLKWGKDDLLYPRTKS